MTVALVVAGLVGFDLFELVRIALVVTDFGVVGLLSDVVFRR